MNSPSIDTLLKVSAPAAKPALTNQAGKDTERFNSYLRQATSSRSDPKPAAKPEPPLPPARQETVDTSGEEQHTTASPEDETVTAETAEKEPTPEEVTETDITDEILISTAAAVSIVEQTDTAPSIEVPAGELTVEAAENVALGDTKPNAEKDTSGANLTFPAELESAFASGVDIETNASPTHSSDQLPDIVEPEQPQATFTDQVTLDADQVAPRVESLTSPVHTSATAAASHATPQQADERTDSPSEEEVSAESKAAISLVDDSLLAATDLIEDLPLDSDKSNGLTEKTTATHSSTSTSSAHPSPSSPTQPLGESSQHAESHNLRAEGESHTPTIDRARFVQRVANAFRSAQQNDGHIQLRLSPPELGQLRIEIAVRNGVLSANLETETADARRVLLDNLPALRQRLAEQDIRIDKFDVDIRREGGQQDGQADAREQQTQHQASRAVTQNRIHTTHSPEVMTTRVPRVSTSATDTGLDVRI